MCDVEGRAPRAPTFRISYFELRTGGFQTRPYSELNYPELFYPFRIFLRTPN